MNELLVALRATKISISVSDSYALITNIVQLDFSADESRKEGEQQPEAEQMQHYVYELPECTRSLVKYSGAQKEGVRAYLGFHRETLVGLSNVFILVRS